MAVPPDRRFEERRARGRRRPPGGAHVLSRRGDDGIHRPRPQGSQNGADALRSRAGAPGRLPVGAGRARPGAPGSGAATTTRWRRSRRRWHSTRRCSDLRRQIDVLKFRRAQRDIAAARQSARREQHRGGAPRLCRRHRELAGQRLSLSGAGGHRAAGGRPRRGAGTLSQGFRARPLRCGVARSDRRNTRGERGPRGSAEGVRGRPRRGAERSHCRTAGRNYRPHRFRTIARGVPDHRRRAAGDARPARGAHRHPAGESSAAVSGHRGWRHHRCARVLGRAVDHGGGSRRRHGALCEPHLPAACDRPPRRPGADCRAAGAAAVAAAAGARLADARKPRSPICCRDISPIPPRPRRSRRA